MREFKQGTASGRVRERKSFRRRALGHLCGTRIKTEVLEKIPPDEGGSKALEILSEPEKPGMKAHEGAIVDLIECIRKQKLPQTRCRDNIKTLAMVFAAIESAEKEEIIRIGE